jgi:ribosomal protein S18 acetylase RimI-like enzyme
MIDMTKIEYTATDEQGLDLVGPLWQKLLEHHKARSPKYFRRHNSGITFDLRKKQLLEKSEKGYLRIDIARDTNTGELVGYCISSVSGNGQGEIDSIYIESEYRRSGIGDNLTKRALGWMDELSVTKKIVVVGVGNEEVFPFYSRYGFYPRNIILEQVETEEGDTSS